ncbi:MAG: calcium-binding protein [Microcoleaceae cyanobacterium]
MALFNGSNLNDVIAPNAIPGNVITGDSIFPSNVPIPEVAFVGNDQIFGQDGDDFLDGDDGNDLLSGGNGQDFLTGNVGNDTLDGGSSPVGFVNDIFGDDGFDYVTYANEFGFIFVNLDANVGSAANRNDNIFEVEGVIGANFSQNTLIGDENNNVLIGGSQDDFLSGQVGDDSLQGQAGNDNLVGDGGRDLLQGGEGNDLYTVNNLAFAGGTRIEDTAGTSDRLVLDPALVVVANAPNTTNVGMVRNGADLVLDIDRNGLADPASDLRIVNFFSGVTGNTAGVGYIEDVGGLSGNTILTSTIVQPIPTVNFVTPAANNTVPGEAVPGVIPFSPVDLANGEKVYLLSNEPDATALPTGQTDRQILGLSGNDNLTGTSSADNVGGNKGADTIGGADGNDTVRGGQGSDVLNGGNGNDLLNGNQDNDTINGGDGDDIIRGGRGDDVLNGNEDEDVLIGDLGRDLLTGGGDEDIFVLISDPATANTLEQTDVMTDFVVGTDKIMLTGGLTFSQITLSQVALQVDGGAAVMSTVIQASGNAYLGIIQGVSNLTATDFIPENTNITGLG